MGLTSRAGIVPLSLLADIAGPMARTVEDAVAIFQIIVGEDPDDPVTLPRDYVQPSLLPGGRPSAIPDYRAALVRDGLKGARIGLLRQAYERDTTDPEIVKVFTGAIEELKRAGAVIVDPAMVDLAQVRRAQGAGTCGGFKYDINRTWQDWATVHPFTRWTTSSGRAASIPQCSFASSGRRKAPRATATRALRARRREITVNSSAPRC